MNRIWVNPTVNFPSLSRQWVILQQSNVWAWGLKQIKQPSNQVQQHETALQVIHCYTDNTGADAVWLLTK